MRPGPAAEPQQRSVHHIAAPQTSSRSSHRALAATHSLPLSLSWYRATDTRLPRSNRGRSHLTTVNLVSALGGAAVGIRAENILACSVERRLPAVRGGCIDTTVWATRGTRRTARRSAQQCVAANSCRCRSSAPRARPRSSRSQRELLVFIREPTTYPATTRTPRTRAYGRTCSDYSYTR